MTTERLNVEELQREIDGERSAKVTRQGEAVAKHAGISVEELDRRMHKEDHRRDAAGLPPLSTAQIAERARVDDFAKDERSPERAEPTTPAATERAKSKQSQEVAGGDVSKDGDEVADRELVDQRRRQLVQQALQKRYAVSDGKYFSREAGNRLAFQDDGSRLRTNENDAYTAASMAMLAQAKGWSAIKVAGTAEFKREMWMQAQLLGMKVKGYTPTEADKAILQDKQAMQARRTASTNVVEKTEGPRSKTDSKTVKPEAAEKGTRGVLLEHGPAPYQNDPKESPSYFVRLETAGGEKTVWGKDLERAIGETKPVIGEAVELMFLGKQAVTVLANVKDQAGAVVGTKEIQTHRNEWLVKTPERAVVESCAEAVVGAKVQNPQVRERVMAEVNKRLDGRQAAQKPMPEVKMYDPKAAPQKRLEPVLPRNRSAERTR